MILDTRYLNLNPREENIIMRIKNLVIIMMIKDLIIIMIRKDPPKDIMITKTRISSKNNEKRKNQMIKRKRFTLLIMAKRKEKKTDRAEEDLEEK